MAVVKWASTGLGWGGGLSRLRTPSAAPWASGPARGPPEAPCAVQQCGNGAPAPLVSASTDFPIKLG